MAGGQVSRDLGPGLAVVGGLVDPGIAVIHEVQVEDDVGGGRIEVRGLDLGDRAEGRHALDVGRDVVPLRPRVVGVPDLAIVGAGPAHAGAQPRPGRAGYTSDASTVR